MEGNSIEDQILELLQALDVQETIDGDTRTSTTQAAVGDQLEEYHIYPLSNGLFVTKEELSEDQLKEGILPEGFTIPHEQEPEAATVIAPPPTHRMNMWIITTILLCCLLVGENVLPIYTVVTSAFFHKPVQVTLFTQVKSFEQSYSYLAVTGHVDPTKQQVTTRLLSAISKPKTLSIQTTGIAITPSVQAHGFVTFYNAAPYQQFISAGTVIQAANGMQVITDQLVAVGAGNPPVSYGISTPVAAHTLQAGSHTNIQAFAINGLCCVAGIAVKNTSAFSGGQDPQSYAVVSQHDLDSATTSLTPLLFQEGQAIITKQVMDTERFLQQTTCTPTANSTPAVGAKAKSAIVTVSTTCAAQVYDYNRLLQQTRELFLHDAQQKLGQAYTPSGGVNMSLATVKQLDSRQHTYALQPQLTSTFVLALSAAHQHQLAGQIAGKKASVARQILLQQAGIQRVDITNQTDPTLPTDPTQIDFIVAAG